MTCHVDVSACTGSVTRFHQVLSDNVDATHVPEISCILEIASHAALYETNLYVYASHHAAVSAKLVLFAREVLIGAKLIHAPVQKALSTLNQISFEEFHNVNGSFFGVGSFHERLTVLHDLVAVKVEEVGIVFLKLNTIGLIISISSWPRRWQCHTYSHPKLNSWLVTDTGFQSGHNHMNQEVSPAGIAGFKSLILSGTQKGTFGAIGLIATIMSSRGFILTVSFHQSSLASGAFITHAQSTLFMTCTLNRWKCIAWVSTQLWVIFHICVQSSATGEIAVMLSLSISVGGSIYQ